MNATLNQKEKELLSALEDVDSFLSEAKSRDTPFDQGEIRIEEKRREEIIRDLQNVHNEMKKQ